MSFEFIIYGAAVHFFNRTVFGSNTWFWDFGDGNTSTVKEPSHTYSGSGTYAVTLTATCGSRTSSVTKNVVIVMPGSPLQCLHNYNTFHNGDTLYLGNLPHDSHWTQSFMIQINGSSPNTVSGVSIVNSAVVSDLTIVDAASNPIIFPYVISTAYPNNVMAMSFVPVLYGSSGLAEFVFINSGTPFAFNVTWDTS